MPPLTLAGVNAEHLKKLVQAKEAILTHPLFHNLQTQDPLPKGHIGGCQLEPYVAEHLEQARSSGTECSDGKSGIFKKYVCGLNLMWVDFVTSITPGVPVNQSSLSKIKEKMLADPTMARACFQDIIIALLPGQTVEKDKGNLRLLSPEESVQALILKVSEDIAAGVDSEILTEWSLILRSVPTTVELHQSGAEKLYWRALNIREEIGTQADTMCRTTVQRLFEVIEFKQRIEQDRVAKKVKGVTMNASAIFEEWNKNVKFSSGATGDKAWKLAYVEAVVLVWTRIMSIPAVMELVLQAEDRLQHDSVWSSIYVLEAVAKKLGISAPTNPQRTRWIVGAIQYFFEVGTMPKTAFSTRNMSGKGLAQSKGTVDLMLLKYGVLELARSKWLEGSGLTAEQKELISSSLEDFGTYQKHFHPGDAVPDLSWQAALPSAGREYLEWMEKMCYGQEHDAGLKNMVLAGAQAADLPDREDFKEMWQKVQKEFKALNLRLQGLEDEGEEEGTQAGASKTASGTDGEDLILMHMHHELDVVQTTPELKEAIKEEEDMHARYNALSLEEKQVVKQAELDARKYVSKLVRLVVEPERRKILDDAIKGFLTVTEQDAGQAGLVVFDCLILMPFFFELYTVTLDCYFIVPIDHLKVLVAFDQKVAGESITAPHLRLPTFKGDRLKSFVASVLDAAESPAQLPPSMVFAVMDAGCFGNKTVIHNCFVAESGTRLTVSSKALYVAFNQEDMVARYQRFHGRV